MSEAARAASAALLLLAAALGAGDRVPLWDGPPAGETLVRAAGEPPEGLLKDGRRTRVLDPWLEPFPAARPGASLVLVFPGGGYGVLAETHEGVAVALELNRLGHAAAVVRYRVPARDLARPWVAPLADGRRALDVARASAVGWNADPAKVVALGFSAGGNLVARLAHQPGADVPRPAAAILVYPAYLLEGRAGGGLRSGPEGLVPAGRPVPTLLLHSEDDPIPVAGSRALAAALRDAGGEVETVFWPDGGHGWGIAGPRAREWLPQVSRWLAGRGLGPSPR